jgi:hypothetical protein
MVIVSTMQPGDREGHHEDHHEDHHQRSLVRKITMKITEAATPNKRCTSRSLKHSALSNILVSAAWWLMNG